MVERRPLYATSDGLTAEVGAADWAKGAAKPYTPPTGQWMHASNFLGSTASAPAASSVMLVPFDVGPIARGFTALGVHVTTAQVAGTTTTTLGLYADDGTGGMPDFTQLLDNSTIVMTATGRKTITLGGGTRTLQPGRYWGAFLYVASVAPTTAAQLNCVNNVSPSLWIPDATNIGTASRALTVAGTALPTTNGQTMGTLATGTCPAMALKAA